MPAAVYAVPTYRRDVLKGVHKDTDSYKLALYTGAVPDPETLAAYTAVGEIAAGGGYVTGGIQLTGFVAGLYGAPKVATLDFDNPIVDPATIDARYGILYNDTLVGKNACFLLDFGQDVVSTNGPWTPNLPLPGALTSLLQW